MTISRGADLLREVLEWELLPAQWAEVATLLPAIADGDQDALQDLELLAPVRVFATFDNEPTGPPARERDRINQLIASLDGGTPDPEDEPTR
ncbi:hypothetical protein Acor_42890 [Acrocarpospora corrugata]|uniref:CATRA-Associated Small Protein domain-containing protein n=1 Tax=Acrocarpospora corrugata TaxID=35763 RepID=A0A5M3W0G7_9ACTN|nr:CATRA system-associated protein [Acrocarpospora corrugata]GES02224.1 hypothetical protein Acor_42890 [Acrocarpospora corrugata]